MEQRCSYGIKGNMEQQGKTFYYDAIVVGAGHAGIEAGLALARLNKKTLILSITLDNIGYLACNPSIGGTAKGHLVREIDALGGEMGIAADKTLTQLRMLNRSKGAAVQSLRAQVDKYAYHDYMKSLLENEPNITLRQGEVKEMIFSGTKIEGVKTVYGQEFYAKAIVLACGVYLKSNIIVGDVSEEKGPVSFNRSNYLSDSLKNMGIEVRRFKTGTPARVKRSTIQLDKLDVQEGESDIYSFSELSKKVDAKKRICYLGYTNLTTHKIISDNIKLAPKYAGKIFGTGARYCPSIEDKIVRFADKERHQFFLEPEGDKTEEMYVQGLSTSLPSFIQHQIYRSIKGFENVEIMRDAYAIEYDCINPLELYPSLMHKGYEGLFFAGQINGTSGYEEAAAQGLVAGINAAKFIDNDDFVILTRDNSYIGVLIDDLVTKGTDEPYRMMTSRAEFRLTLRQDNADIRLTDIGRKAGLVTDKRYKMFLKKKKHIKKAYEELDKAVSRESAKIVFDFYLQELPEVKLTGKEIIKRLPITAADLNNFPDIFGGIDKNAAHCVVSEVRYEGYLARAERMIAEQKRLENIALPTDMDYSFFSGLRLEAIEKLNKVKPLSIGQASRISGVSPADINILLISIKNRSQT